MLTVALHPSKHFQCSVLQIAYNVYLKQVLSRMAEALLAASNVLCNAETTCELTDSVDVICVFAWIGAP